MGKAKLATALAFLGMLASFRAEAEAETWTSRALAVPEGIEALVRNGRDVLVHTRQPGAGGARYHRVHRGADGLFLEPLANFEFAASENREDMLPDGEVGYGRRGIAEAWLAGPTRRYGHRVLGDAIEAGAIVTISEDAVERRLDLEGDKVFEDRLARIVDMDGDGRDEIVVVRSDIHYGAALAVLGIVGDELRLLAETTPIGTSHRWLNPAGFGHFDGDGRIEVAVVITPQIGGTLEIYEYTRASIRREASVHGFSNHVMGSRKLAMSMVLDGDGDGTMDLVLPSASRRDLRIVAFSSGVFRDIATLAHDAEIQTAIHSIDFDSDGRRELLYGLSDGRLIWSGPGRVPHTEK